MDYMILIHTAENAKAPDPGTPEFDEYMAGWMAYNQRLIDGGHWIAGGSLQATATATTIRRDAAGTQSITDGPTPNQGATRPRGTIPTNPAGWLMTVASRKAIDSIRRANSRDRRLGLAANETQRMSESPDAVRQGGAVLMTDGGLRIDDDRL